MLNVVRQEITVVIKFNLPCVLNVLVVEKQFHKVI